MSENIRSMVEERGKEVNTARNLADAANSNQSLEGYASINGIGDDQEIAENGLPAVPGAYRNQLRRLRGG